MATNEPTYATDSRHREQMGSCPRGGGWGRDGLGVSVSRGKLVYTGWMNKVPLYSTGN